MVEWLAGKRVRGTSSERTPLGTTLDGTGVGGWVELGRTTLGSAGDTIDVSGLSDKRYYMILSDLQASGNIQSAEFRCNADSGSNYAYRVNDNGGTDSATASRTGLVNGVAQSSTPQFAVGYCANLSTKEKLNIYFGVGQNTAGAGNAPNRRESYCKWANTSDAIDQFTHNNLGSGSYNTGSELVVLGWDPADTHTNNFWEELADVDWSSGSTFDTGTFTAKKYLWIQYYTKSASAYNNFFRCGNTTLDTGSNYTSRRSEAGGADSTVTSQIRGRLSGGSYTDFTFGNIFVINNASNEKLFIGHEVRQNTAGASTEPYRIESVSKWDDTSNQIDIFGLDTTSADYSAGKIKVWGAD